jgi:hypothetical protein
VQLLVSLPLAYICACSYYALFHISAFDYNKLLPRASTGAALMQVRCVCVGRGARGGGGACPWLAAARSGLAAASTKRLLPAGVAPARGQSPVHHSTGAAGQCTLAPWQPPTQSRLPRAKQKRPLKANAEHTDRRRTASPTQTHRRPAPPTQNGSLMCRFAAPTCWNFLYMVHMAMPGAGPRTVFAQKMGSMETVLPFLTGHLNVYLPSLLVVHCALIALNLWDRLAGMCVGAKYR